MLLLVQWARDTPGDWVEVDAADFAALPKRREPTGGEDLASDGYVMAINVMGEVWDGYDHYRVAVDGDGVKVTAWTLEHAREATYTPMGPRAELGGAISPHVVHTVWGEAELAARYPGGSKTTVVEVQDLAREWAVPADDADVRHGVPGDLEAHEAARAVEGWRSARWCGHLEPSELNPDGTLKGQRAQGRYTPLEHTRTYFHSTTALANPLYGATNENELSLATAAAGTQSDSVGAAGALSWASTTPANEPDTAAWPTGAYRAQLDVVTAGVNLIFGLTLGGYFARVDAALATELETHTQDEVVFSGTGLHLATYTGGWVAGTATDRLAIVVGVDRVGGAGNQTIELELNEADDFVDGDWPGPTQSAPSVAASGAWSAPGASVVTLAPVSGVAASGSWVAPPATVVTLAPAPAVAASGAWVAPAATVATVTRAIGSPAFSRWGAPSADVSPGDAVAPGVAASGAWVAPVALALAGDSFGPGVSASGAWTAPPASVVVGAVVAPAVASEGSWVAVGAVVAVGDVVALGVSAEGSWASVDALAVAGDATAPGVAGVGSWVAPAATVAAGAVTASGTAAAGSWASLAASVGVDDVVAPTAAAEGSWTAPAASVAVGAVIALGDASVGSWSAPASDVGLGAVAAPGVAASGAWVANAAGVVVVTFVDGAAAFGSWVAPGAAVAVGDVIAVGVAAEGFWTAPAASGVLGSRGAFSDTLVYPTADVDTEAFPTATIDTEA